MELPIKLLEQIAFKTRTKIEGRMLFVLNESFDEEHFSQPFQTNYRRLKNAFNFLAGYNGVFNNTDKINKFYFAKPITDKDGFNQIEKPKGGYQLESLSEKIKSIILKKTISPKQIIHSPYASNFQHLDLL